MIKQIQECPFLGKVTDIIRDIQKTREQLDQPHATKEEREKLKCLSLLQYELEQVVTNATKRSEDVRKMEKSILNGITDSAQIEVVVSQLLHPVH